ncbi:hypothetical protein Xvie_03343 [Xenorhabdus vietnamensis]|uniref:Wzy n=1 Tax=Xenorhabdus vietnamensis TaxID=351656 RepID=A0A1Y2S804_9GAMM|nr:hypothetical protein Xvie_03343 [Xenorhabdus vietnamensis]
MNTLLLTLSILSASLISFNPYINIITLFFSFSSFIYCKTNNYNINYKFIKVIFGISLILLSFLSLSFILFSIENSNIFTSFKDNTIINNSINKFISIINYFMISISLFRIKEDHDCIAKVISKVLNVHLIFFYIQTIVIYSTGYYVDIVKFITGEESRYINVWHNTANSIILYRPTGLLVEPSTYAVVLSSLLIPLYLIRKKISILFILSMISLLICNSSVGKILFVLIFIIIIQKIYIRKVKIYNFILLTLLCIISIVAIVYPSLIDIFISRAQYTLKLRIETIRLILDRDLWDLIIGKGYFLIEDKIYNSNLNEMNREYATIADIGFILYSFSVSLILSLILFIFIFLNLKRKIYYFIPILALLITKLNFEHSIFWISITLIILISQKRQYENNLTNS